MHLPVRRRRQHAEQSAFSLHSTVGTPCKPSHTYTACVVTGAYTHTPPCKIRHTHTTSILNGRRPVHAHLSLHDACHTHRAYPYRQGAPPQQLV